MRHWPWFALLIVAALGIRLGLAVTHANYLGVDGGAYFQSVLDVLGRGNDISAPGLPRPPLAPGWLLVPFYHFFGIDLGFKLFSAIVAVFPLLAVYLVAQRFVARRWATVAALLVSIEWLHAEMFVTGVTPFIGFSLIFVVFWGLFSLSRGWDTKVAAITAAAIPLIAFTQQTSLGLFVVYTPILLAGLFMFNANRFRRLELAVWLLPPLILGGFVAFSALPWYANQMPGSDVVKYPGPWVSLNFINWFWFQAFYGIPIALFVLFKTLSPSLKSFAVLTLVVLSLGLFESNDEAIINILYRSGYMAPMFLAVLTAWTAEYVWSRHVFKSPQLRGAVLAGFAVFVALVGVRYGYQFKAQAEYSDMVTPDTVAALAYMDDGDGGVIANSYTLALWISSISERPADWTNTWQPPAGYQPRDEAVRCIMGWVDGCDVNASIHLLNAEYVYVDERFPYYNDRALPIYGAPEQPWPLSPQPWLEPVFEQGQVRLWKIHASNSDTLRLQSH